MKLALSFFGQPRFVQNKKVLDSYKRYYLDRYDTDVFCHMWWEKGAEYDVSSWVRIRENNFVPFNAPEIVREYYDPIVLETEPPRKFQFPSETLKFIDEKFTGKATNWKHSNYSNLLSQLYSIQRSSRALKKYMDETGVRYDFIVLARYDTIVRGVPDLEQCEEKLHLPNHRSNFPDLVMFYPLKHLDWSTNVFDDVSDPQVYENIFSPSPEGFKFFSFRKRFPITEIKPISMSGKCIRS